MPLVSTATLNLLAFKLLISNLSNCNKGSPPVKTTNLFLLKLGHNFVILSTKLSNVYCPPKTPLVPRKSVSQKEQIDFNLSFS